MDKINTKIFYKNLDIPIKNRKNLKIPSFVFTQELVTWKHIKSGIKRTTFIRSFKDKSDVDNYISESFSF